MLFDINCLYKNGVEGRSFMKKGIACAMAALFMVSPLAIGDNVYATDKAAPILNVDESRGYVYTYQISDSAYAKYMSIYNDERGGGTRTDDKGHKLQPVAFNCGGSKYVCRFRVKSEANREDIIMYVSEYKEILNQLSSQNAQVVEDYLDELLEKDIISFYTCGLIEND